MHQWVRTAWARSCITLIVIAVLLASSGMGSVAHALSGCDHPISTPDGVADAHDHGHPSHDMEVAGDHHSADGQTSAHVDCCGHLCHVLDTSRVAVLLDPGFAARTFAVMLRGLGPDAPERSMERPPSMTAEI